MKASLLASFFSDDPEEALRALPALAAEAGEGDRSHGAVTSIETLYSVAGQDRLRAERRGIFSEVIFGPALEDRCACGTTTGEASRGVTCPRCGVLCDRASLRDERWGRVDVVNLVHPSVLMHIADALGVYYEYLRDVALGKKALRPVKAPETEVEASAPETGAHKKKPQGAKARNAKVRKKKEAPTPRWTAVSADDTQDDDLIGPGGIAEALRRSAPEHRLLPLCTLTKVPIPPAGERPFAPLSEPTQVDPWIGPLNEAWVALVERANRERRLVELAAPPIILRNESVLAQQAFETVLQLTRRSSSRLVPPLVRPPEKLEEAEALAIAFVGPDRLIVQRRDRVSILDLSGKELVALPPAGTSLRGVAACRYAVFEGFFSATHPMLAQDDTGFGPDFVHVDEDGCTIMARILGEISVVDCQTGTYLDRLPQDVRLRFATNDQPEDLFLSGEDGQPLRRLRAGGDRPRAIAYAPGMALAWVGEEGNGTEIVDLDKGLPHALPSEPHGEDTPRWDLLPPAPKGKGAEKDDKEEEDEENDEDDDEELYSASAVAFCDGAWHLLWSNSILCDHRMRRPVRLRPPPGAAAFDPTGRTLALVALGTVVLADVARREVIRRFPLPASPGSA
jgi:hypothetical protein